MDLNSTQVDLLIAILVRFPYIGTIHCEPETGTLRLVFLLNEPEQGLKDLPGVSGLILPFSNSSWADPCRRLPCV